MVGGVRALQKCSILETVSDTYAMVIALLLVSIVVASEPQTVLVLQPLFVIAATGFLCSAIPRSAMRMCSARYANSSPIRDDLLDIMHPAYLAKITALLRLYF